MVLQFLFGCDALSIGGFSKSVKAEVTITMNKKKHEWTRMDTNKEGPIRVHSCSFVVLQFLFGFDALSIGAFSKSIKTEVAIAVN